MSFGISLLYLPNFTVRRRKKRRRSTFHRAADQRGEDGCKAEKEVRSVDKPSGKHFGAGK